MYEDGRLKTVTNPDTTTVTYHYDLLGWRTLVEDPSGQTHFEYDLWDNLIALTDAENQRTEFEYDPDGRLKLERRPMLEETVYEYDPKGRLWTITDAKQQTTEYGYDGRGRLAQIAYDDGRTVTLRYDGDGNLSGYSDGTTSATYTYDDVGRKLSETVNYGTFSKSFSYTYYKNGLKKTFTAPDDSVYSYTYGFNNELHAVQIPNVGGITFTDYAWTRPGTVSFPGGVTRSLIYDDLMRLDSLSVTAPGGSALMQYDYTYNPAGNILTKTTEHGMYAYDYDLSSRLKSADNPALEDEAYTYDAAGNRQTALNTGGLWLYNDNNELLGYDDVEYTYDDNGNLTEIRKAGTVVWTYTYNAANRLIHAEDGLSTVVADYYYDPFGRRLWKEVNGERTYFFYSDEGLIAEYNESGTEIRSYGYQPDSTWTTDPLFLKKGGEYYWYQNDHLGTPQKLVNSSGTVIWSAQYAAFGKATIEIETITNNLRFPGQYFDAETGLHYNWFRYYDLEIGRYISTDPFGLFGEDVNLYAYVWNDPNGIKDAYGLLSDSGSTIDYLKEILQQEAPGKSRKKIPIKLPKGVGIGVIVLLDILLDADSLDLTLEEEEEFLEEIARIEEQYRQDVEDATDDDDDDCVPDDFGRQCQKQELTPILVIATRTFGNLYEHAFLNVPDRGNIGWHAVSGAERHRVRVERRGEDHITPGEVRDDSKYLFKAPFTPERYSACAPPDDLLNNSVEAIKKSIDKRSHGSFNFLNRGARNCAGWVCEVLEGAGWAPLTGQKLYAPEFVTCHSEGLKAIHLTPGGRTVPRMKSSE